MDLYSVGEMVVDFMPGNEANSYIPNAGGAPANVAIAVARNGLDAGIACKVGDDDFGHFLLKTLKENQVTALCPDTTREATTTLVFVTLREGGERSFTFARKPGADMLLLPEDIKEADIAASKIIHAGSCSLSREPAASATVKALKLGAEMKKLVSFDVNYRNLMWDNNAEAAVKKIMEIFPYVDLLKISEEEAEMLGGEKNIPFLMKTHGITVVIETLGKTGAKCFFGSEVIISHAEPGDAVDATGAGDAFWGGFLSELFLRNVTATEHLTESILEEALKTGNISGCLCVKKKGAISSLPTRREIENYIKGSNQHEHRG
jgi:sugar/nucleoside kinase (ribokinase family)